MAIKKSHEEFIEALSHAYPDLYSTLEFIESYKSRHTPLLIKTAYGVCKVTPGSLMRGYTPGIVSAVNPTEYFINLFAYRQPELSKIVKILGKYVHKEAHILVESTYGQHLMVPNNLLRGTTPSVESALDKTQFFINQAKQVHNDLYIYDTVEYKDIFTKVSIQCPLHGKFEQAPVNHLAGRGCSKCGRTKVKEARQANPTGWNRTNWTKQSTKSAHFDSFKVYVLKCWDEHETFYKIGRTFSTVNRRLRTLPYQYQIVDEIVGDSTYVFNLENSLKHLNKNHKYLPRKQFHGRYECFSTINYNRHEC